LRQEVGELGAGCGYPVWP